MRKRLRRLGTIGVALFATYLIAGNVFLNTGLGPWAINRKPERFALVWSHGVTWWPGFVAMWNVEAKGHMRHVLWDAQAARATGRIALLPLFARELRLASMDIAEVSGNVTRSDQEMQPPPARPGGWTLRFDRIATSSLRRAHVLGIDIETTGTAEFGFIKQLRGGPIEVLPSRVVLGDTSVKIGETLLLREARIESVFAIARHVREDAPGIAKLALTDATLRIDGALPALVLDLDSNGHWHGAVASAAAAGRVEADLALTQGVLQSGGMLDLRLPLKATRGSTDSDAIGTLRVDVQDHGLHVVAHLPPPPEGEGSIDADLTIAGTTLLPIGDARALLARTSGSLDLDWHFAALDWLTPLLVKTPWIALEGAGTVKAGLRIAQGQLEPGSRVDIPQVDLAATVAGHRFRGSAVAEGKLVDANGGPQAHITLVVARFDAVADDARDTPLLRGSDLRIDLQSAGDAHDLRDSLRAQMRFANAEVPDLRAINPYLPSDSLRLLGGNLRIGGDLALDAGGSISRGRIDLNGRAAKTQFGAINLTADFDLDARIGGTDIAARYFDLDHTTLNLRNVRVIDDGHTAGEQWWANVGFRRGRVEATRPFKIDADATVEMQNIGLLLALFTKQRDYPKWALRLADAGSVSASGMLRIDGRTLVFDRIEAKNDRFDVKARMRIAGKQPTGDLLLSWGVLSLGVEVDKGGADTRVIGAKKWYEERPHLLDAR